MSHSQVMLKPIASLILLAAWGALIRPVPSQHWIQTSAPIINWFSIACSTNCSRIVAVAMAGSNAQGDWPSPIFMSADGGRTWQPTSTPLTNWFSVACSADGEKIFATADAYPGGEAFWTSTNAGASWDTSKIPRGDWVACSVDGNKLFARFENCMETSMDGGRSWSTNNCIPFTRVIQSGVSSADGTKLAALAIDSESTFFWLEASTNSGETWAELPGPDNSNDYGSVACSADGSLLVVAMPLLGIYISRDWGQSWQQANSARGMRVTISANGIRLFMENGSSIYRSTDSGSSWTNMDAPGVTWGPLASSADGNTLVAAAAQNGGIYLWRATTSPELSIAVLRGKLMLSWNAPSGAILEQSIDLSQGNWTPLTIPPTLTNGQYQLIVPTTNATSFFRLNES